MDNKRSSLSDPAAFNVFRTLRLESHEIRHSNVLAWLLNPDESHGQQELFLRLFTSAVADALGEGRAICTTLKADLSSGGDVEVRREAKRLDLQILLRQSSVVIGIENKLLASEHADQLHRYADALENEFPDSQRLLLYLTLDGDAPSDPRWNPITHRLVIQVVKQGLATLQVNTPGAIRDFIQQYVDVLSDICSMRASSRSQFLSAEVIAKLDRMEAAMGDIEEPIPGFRRFHAAMQMIVAVPKSEVDKSMARCKETRRQHRKPRKK